MSVTPRSLRLWKTCQAFIPSVGFAVFIAAARWFSGGGFFEGFCLFHRFLGIDCPGCGLTRSMVALSHGRLAESWQLHRAGLAVAAYFAALAIVALLEVFSRVNPEVAARFRRLANVCLTVLLIAAWLHKLIEAGVYVRGT